MLSLTKILVPVDFSERSLGAARYGKILADQFHSELTLVHVLPPPHYEFSGLEIGGAMLSELYNTKAAQLEKDLESFAAGELGQLPVKRAVLQGDPAQRIVSYAQSDGSSLIVMPTHGYGPFRRFILGSNTAKVLHDADCPVWTGVHIQQAPVQECLSIRRILCAIDLGPQSCRTLEWAAGMQARFGARLFVVHAIVGAPPRPADSGEIDWLSRLENAAREEIERLQERAGVEAEIAMEAGDPPKVVCAAAERLAADLLVIGRGSARGVFGRLQMNAYAIIRQSPCPVVSV